MKTFSLNKVIAIFALLFLIGGGKTLAETTATLQASSTDPSLGRPEFAYTINNVNVLNGTTIDYGYWNVNLYSVVNSPANAAAFAFYAVAGKSNTYYIYNYSAKKWVTYDLATSYNNMKGFLKLSDTKTEGCYFEITSCTKDTHSGYQMRPYASDGTIDTDRYLNYNGGNGANESITVGLWQDPGSSDAGSCWILKEADLGVKANITNTSLATGSIVNSLYTNYQGNGTKFVKETAIDWTNQKVVAEIDISTCGTGTEDLFSIGEDAITWFANNIHMYKKNDGNITAYLVGNPVSGGATAFESSTLPDGNMLRVELSSEKGFVVNDVVVFSKEIINQYSEHYYSKQFFSLSTIKVGSGENNQNSRAKYNYISVVTNDYQAATATSSNTLDEVTVNTFNAQNDVDVQLKRSLTPTQWNTFCVPFTISADVIAEKFGAGTLVYTFGSMTGNVMNFAPSTTIEAGKPYIVKPAKEVVDPTFTGVNIVASAPVKSGENGFFMQGTYGAKTDLLDDGTNLFLGEGNKFYKPAKGSTKMKGMRAFFIVPQGTNFAALRANIDGATTAIDELTTVVEQPTDNRIYNLQGQFVGTSFEGLHGVYVQNGKKVLVK